MIQSWQCGGNENTTGLLRRYILRGNRFRALFWGRQGEASSEMLEHGNSNLLDDLCIFAVE
jgi:hypothetical protein